jgi:hypothetical protein
MAGLRQHFLGGSDFDNPPQIHHSDPLGDLSHDCEVMGDKQVGQATPLLQVHQEVEYLSLN